MRNKVYIRSLSNSLKKSERLNERKFELMSKSSHEMSESSHKMSEIRTTSTKYRSTCAKYRAATSNSTLEIPLKKCETCAIFRFVFGLV